MVGAFYGHALAGVRVQRVQKVLRVQRVAVGAFRKKGRQFG